MHGARQVMELAGTKKLPFLVMTSPSNHADTVAHFEANKCAANPGVV